MIIKEKPQYQTTFKGDHVTIIACINAAGRAIFPTLIFTGLSVPNYDPCGCDMTSSPSGWVDTKIK